MPAPHPLWITGDPDADALLSRDGNALLVGMVLDQQVPMEKAFSGPAVIATRMGGQFDVPAIAALPVEEFVALCSQRPAVHRFPGSMGTRVHAVADTLLQRYDGEASRLWDTAAAGGELARALTALPGFGTQKAAIMVALLGKQWGVQPPGWREAAGPYGEAGVYRSVADVVDAESLQRVRETKQQAKRQAKQQVTRS